MLSQKGWKFPISCSYSSAIILKKNWYDEFYKWQKEKTRNPACLCNAVFIYFFRTQLGNVHAASVAGSESGTGSDNTASTVVDKTNSMVQSGAKQTLRRVEDVGEVFKSLIKNTGATVMDFGKETSKSLEEITLAGGRATLAVGYLCSQLFNGLSATVATGTGYLASGIKNIDDVMGEWPVVGMVTSSINAVTTNLANTVGEMSESGQKSRNKMIENLREHLNQSGGRLPQVSTSDASNTTEVEVSAT